MTEAAPFGLIPIFYGERVTEPLPSGEAGSEEPEHRASWLELFFDLVVVVAISTLTARIESDAGIVALAKVLIMYLAIWLVWTSFMLYANVAAEKAHRRAMLLAMGCIAVMAASVPGIDDFRRGEVFATAYIIARVIASRTWRNTSRVLVEWPIAQMSVGLVPWIVSLWTVGSGRYYLWAAGLLLDMIFALKPRSSQALVERVQRESDQRPGRGRSGRGRESVDPTQPVIEFQAVDVDQSHFGERLGTFTIIVLGEAVTQVVTAASRIEWNRQFDVSAVAASVLLFGLWWLTFQYSSYVEGDTKVDKLPPHLALPVHFLTTAAIMLIAAGLGEIVSEPAHPLGTDLRWLLAGGLAGYLLASQAALALAEWSRPWWLATFGVIVVATPLLLAGFGEEIPGWVLAPALTLVVGGQVSFRKLDALLRQRR